MKTKNYNHRTQKLVTKKDVNVTKSKYKYKLKISKRVNGWMFMQE